MDYREPQDGDFQKLTELLSQSMANQSPQLQPPQARAMPNYAPGQPFSHPQTPTPSYSQSRATPSGTCAQTREPAAYASRPGYPNKGASKDKPQSSVDVPNNSTGGMSLYPYKNKKTIACIQRFPKVN